MKSATLLLTLSLSVPPAFGAVNYSDLEHIDPSYMANLQAAPGQIGFMNFQGSREGQDFMVTVFFGLDNPLTILPWDQGELGSSTNTFASGTLGLYVYNMDQGSPLGPGFWNEAAMFGDIEFFEITMLNGDGPAYYEDSFTVNAGAAYFRYWNHNNNSPEGDTTTTIDSSGATTMGQIGLLSAVSDPLLSEWVFTEAGGFFGLDPITGNLIHSTGIVVPEPSTVLLGLLTVPVLLRRRR
jgi:hypothetical protein